MISRSPIQFTVIVLFFYCYCVHCNICGPLYLTINALNDHKLELNWNFTCMDHPDTILLTDTENKTVFETLIISNRYGYHKTKISFDIVSPFPGNWNNNTESKIFGPSCFNYAIVSRIMGKTIDWQCLKIQPTWMENFETMTLSDLLLPGTHDSGALKIPAIVNRYYETQDYDFWGQLVWGIRYFDVRVGYYNDEFYIVHSFVRTVKLIPELIKVRDFLNFSPKEIVILDFHKFEYPENFTEELHLKLLAVIKDTLGDYIYQTPRYISKYGPELREFWSDDQRVIIHYNDIQKLKDTPWLWNGLTRYWGDKREVDELETYIKNVTSSPNEEHTLKLLMAELTPNFVYVLTNPIGSLRIMANKVNPLLGPWLRENERSNNVNIVATDFFSGNDMINLALETNFRKKALKHELN